LDLKQIFNLSDGKLEFHFNDRRPFEQSVGSGIINCIPDATTIASLRERFRKVEVIKEHFEAFDVYLPAHGLDACGSQILVASLVAVSNQFNAWEEVTDIKAC
jgi:IS5 family transposase